MILHGFMWFDKVDKVFMNDSLVLDRSTRAVCRGYLQSFEQNRKLSYKEFSLNHVLDFDDKTGEVTPIYPPEVIDPTIVYDKAEPKTEGEEVDI